MSSDRLSRLTRQITDLAVFLHTELTSLPRHDSAVPVSDLSQVLKLDPGEALAQAKDRVAELVKFKRDVMMTREYEDFRTMQQYQGALQKLESEVRNHIKVEQQLKIHIENLHGRMEDTERDSEKLKKENRHLTDKLKETLEDTQSSTRDSTRKEDQSKLLQEIMQLRHFSKRDQTRISELEKLVGRLEAESIVQRTELLDKSKDCEKLLRELEKYKTLVSHMKENIQFAGELRTEASKKSLGDDSRSATPFAVSSQKKLNSTQRSTSTERIKRPLTATRRVNLQRR